MHLLQIRIFSSQDRYQELLQANGASAQQILDILHKVFQHTCNCIDPNWFFLTAIELSFD